MFIRLMDELSGTENRLAVSRMRYNEQVQANTCARASRQHDGRIFASRRSIHFAGADTFKRRARSTSGMAHAAGRPGLAEFDHEMASTRRVLARARRKAQLAPRKSWTLGGISTHLANLPVRACRFSRKTPTTGARRRRAPVEEQRRDVLRFDRHVSERAALVEITRGELVVPWSLKRDGVVMMSVPRIQAFKSFAINHAVHHRGQLTVYLRLLNIPLPPIYGPTADEAS